VLKKNAFWFNIAVALTILAIGIIELHLFSPDEWFTKLDEQTFIKWAQQSVSEIKAKGNRYFLFIILTRETLGSAGEGLALKVQSIPFAILTSLVIYDATKLRVTLWLFPIIFSFLFFFATLVMRDSIIIFVTIWLCLKVSRSKAASLPMWTALGWAFYYFIRPEAGWLFLFTLLWYFIYRFLKRDVVVIYFIPTFLILFIFVTPIADYLIDFVGIYYGDRIDLYTINRSQELKNLPFISENAAATIRQLFTPFPLSKLARFLTIGAGENLYIYEFVRMIMMSSFYFLTLYCLIFWRKIWRVFAQNDFLKLVFGIALAYTLAYAIYADGGGDSRNKIYPYLLLYLFFVMTIHQLKIFGLANNTNHPATI